MNIQHTEPMKILHDCLKPEPLSKCCAAVIIQGGICSACKGHIGPEVKRFTYGAGWVEEQGDGNYDVFSGEPWGYTRLVTARVYVSNGKPVCCFFECGKYAKKYKDFKCKHVRLLEKHLKNI